jgi:hypothetical protein
MSRAMLTAIRECNLQLLVMFQIVSAYVVSQAVPTMNNKSATECNLQLFIVPCVSDLVLLSLDCISQSKHTILGSLHLLLVFVHA